MRVGSWSVGGIVALSALAVSSRHASAQNAPPKKLPSFHVDVGEYTFMGGYGYDINDRGQVALPSLPADGSSGLAARRWDPKDGLQTVGPSGSMATGINKHGDVTMVHEGDKFRSSLWTGRDGLTDLGTIG